jgi:hypothetical protein
MTGQRQLWSSGFREREEHTLPVGVARRGSRAKVAEERSMGGVELTVLEINVPVPEVADVGGGRFSRGRGIRVSP